MNVAAFIKMYNFVMKHHDQFDHSFHHVNQQGKHTGCFVSMAIIANSTQPKISQLKLLEGLESLTLITKAQEILGLTTAQMMDLAFTRSFR